jgi:hypothetical protein
MPMVFCLIESEGWTSNGTVFATVSTIIGFVKSDISIKVQTHLTAALTTISWRSTRAFSRNGRMHSEVTEEPRKAQTSGILTQNA